MQLIIMFLTSLLIIHLIKIYNYKYICYIYNCGKTNGYENKYPCLWEIEWINCSFGQLILIWGSS